MTIYRGYAPAAVLALGCALLIKTRDQRAIPLVAPLQTISISAPGYTTTNRVIDAEERRVAGMSDYLMRIYSKDSSAFSVYVGYYDRQSQGHTIHSPRNCLPGAGWEPLSHGPADVAAGGRSYRVNRYLLANGAARALVYYWYQGRGRIESDEYVVKWNLLRDAAVAGRSDEALVRIVVGVPRAAPGQPADAAFAHADSVATAAAGQLLGEVARTLPRAAQG